ncbi:hypothetical protein PGTUg99_033211 [Puccinia graminis f. sp. tritici]|uniref:Uncharacterized protein n=1 Tax=Puccinia graminis f. sp. tritici TaxID=56615 RepID=A0A5B0QS34_PUCGR|nr:hypothetical protein PGTUg99_033211 [Puccinia graminis f. sp. tritici]
MIRIGYRQRIRIVASDWARWPGTWQSDPTMPMARACVRLEPSPYFVIRKPSGIVKCISQTRHLQRDSMSDRHAASSANLQKTNVNFDSSEDLTDAHTKTFTGDQNSSGHQNQAPAQNQLEAVPGDGVVAASALDASTCIWRPKIMKFPSGAPSESNAPDLSIRRVYSSPHSLLLSLKHPQTFHISDFESQLLPGLTSAANRHYHFGHNERPTSAQSLEVIDLRALY